MLHMKKLPPTRIYRMQLKDEKLYQRYLNIMEQCKNDVDDWYDTTIMNHLDSTEFYNVRYRDKLLIENVHIITVSPRIIFYNLDKITQLIRRNAKNYGKQTKI